MPNRRNLVVYLPDEGCLGVVAQYNAFFSIVDYQVDGISYSVQISNEDLIFVEEDNILEEEDF